jgi:hypothetical protein
LIKRAGRELSGLLENTDQTQRAQAKARAGQECSTRHDLRNAKV